MLFVGISQILNAQCSGKKFTATVTGMGVILFPTPAYGLNNTYTWSYGDSNGDTLGIIGGTNHTYLNGGTYNVCLHFTDGSCDTNMCQNVTIVAPCSTTPSFTYDNTQPVVAFTSNIPFSLNSNFIWNYGDGGLIDTLPSIGNTQHAYASIGTYTVCLKVEDIVNNCSKSVCQQVVVTSVLGIKNNDALLSGLTSFPNPFNSSTTLTYNLVKETNVEINMYDVLGNVVYMVKNMKEQAGSHSVNFNTNSLPNGPYTVRIITDNGYTSKILVKN